MRKLRAVLLGVPPLLADIIRLPLASRLEASGVALSIVEPNEAQTVPDVVIVHQSARPEVPELLSGATAILTLSADLAELFGPAPNQVAALTPDNLAAALHAIAQALPPP